MGTITCSFEDYDYLTLEKVDEQSIKMLVDSFRSYTLESIQIRIGRMMVILDPTKMLDKAYLQAEQKEHKARMQNTTDAFDLRSYRFFDDFLTLMLKELE